MMHAVTGSVSSLGVGGDMSQDGEEERSGGRAVCKMSTCGDYRGRGAHTGM